VGRGGACELPDDQLFVTFFLLPNNPGRFVIWDGAKYWDAKRPRQVLRPRFRAAGVDAIYLPARSPWLNPIEKGVRVVQERLRSDNGFSSSDRPLSYILDAVDGIGVELCARFINFLWEHVDQELSELRIVA